MTIEAALALADMIGQDHGRRLDVCVMFPPDPTKVNEVFVRVSYPVFFFRRKRSFDFHSLEEWIQWLNERGLK